ncbi:hypothetical protein [Tenacibaculum amylolyticum]|uniref:hypothetical protein n=1 Tax=Tenacibaculum amylolyticum TaxID=104269 RepID=UPI0038B67467
MEKNNKNKNKKKKKKKNKKKKRKSLSYGDVFLFLVISLSITYIVYLALSILMGEYSLIVIIYSWIIILMFFYKIDSMNSLVLIIIACLIYLNGFLLGKSYAKLFYEQGKSSTKLLDSNNHNILKKSQIIIGQNETAFIILDKNDSIVNYIKKSDIEKVSFKAKTR